MVIVIDTLGNSENFGPFPSQQAAERKLKKNNWELKIAGAESVWIKDGTIAELSGHLMATIVTLHPPGAIDREERRKR